MKKKLLVCMVFMLVAACLFSEIKLKAVTGYVQIKANPADDWAQVNVGAVLQPGFMIYTGFNSTALIKTDDSEIEVKPLSQISIASLIATSEKITTDINLKYGKIKAEVNTDKETQTLFKVRSANSTASVRGTVFTFGDDHLFVEDGTVHLLSNNGFSSLVQKGEKAEASKLNFILTPLDQKILEAFVDSLPVGVSDSETGADTLLGEKISGKAKVIVRINVID